MELIIALVLFIGMVVCWFVLPGTVSTSTMYQEEELSSAAIPQGSLNR